jgi:TonB family protein
MWRSLFFTILIIAVAFFDVIAQGNLPCANFVAGKIVNLPKPNFPSEAKKAKAGGKVEIRVKANESGDVIFTEVVSGNPLLLESSVEAAKRAKYAPQTCDGKAMITNGSIVYNFLLPVVETYFSAEKVDDFVDVTRENEAFEAIFRLTENSKIAFGTTEKKFEPEKNLTRGEFIEFLARTMGFLEEQSKLLRKEKQTANLFKSFNPKKLKTASDIKDFDETRPFATSLQTLLEKYKIVFVNEANNFNGSFPMSQNEIVTYWSEIFGEDSIPVNFSNDKLKVINRGEFAIFLSESLEVLTYRLLPE